MIKMYIQEKKSGPNSQLPLGGSKMMTYCVNFTSMKKLSYKKLFKQK